MLDKLLIIKAKHLSNPSNYSKEVKRDTNLLNWIEGSLLERFGPVVREEPLVAKLFLIENPSASLFCKYSNKMNFYNKKYNCTKKCKCTKEQTEKTMQDRYGVTNIFANDKIKEKIRETNKEKYGVVFPMMNKNINDKRESTNLVKYGVTSPAKNMDVQLKIKNTNNQKYGVDYLLGDKNFRNQIRNSNREKYGVDFSSQFHILPDAWEILNDPIKFKETLELTSVQEMADVLGVSRSKIGTLYKKYGFTFLRGNSSSYEQEIGQFLRCKNIEFRQNTRNVIPPFEIDFFIPSSNLAIEFDGLYWHSENNIPNKFYHFNKTKKCMEHGIKLIHIFEDEWLYRKDICLDLINRSLKIEASKKIMARKCHVREITSCTARLFLEENHLQGYTSASKKLGLFYKDQLIQVMTLKTPRYNKNIQFELLRISSKIGFTIIGGIEKLWAAFVKMYNPESVISYCDSRWFDGNIYKKLGFAQINKAKPSYWYTKGFMRFHRSILTKKNCVKKALIMNSTLKCEYLNSLTEKQIAENILGFNRIWDCGQLSFVWRRSPTK